MSKTEIINIYFEQCYTLLNIKTGYTSGNVQAKWQAPGTSIAAVGTWKSTPAGQRRLDRSEQPEKLR